MAKSMDDFEASEGNFEDVGEDERGGIDGKWTRSDKKW
jgi:hypothetical protein